MKKLLVSLFAVALLAGCSNGGSDEKTIVIGASPTPHAEIIDHIKPVLENEGYTVEVKEFTEYVKMNQALAEGSLDVNFFQHQPYLDGWVKDAKEEGKLTSVFAVHFEPLGIYSTSHKALSELADGQKIAIPSDATNGGRALKLLEANKIITLKDGVGIEATQKDIVDNPKNVEIIEMPAESCAINIADVDYSVVNGNNALNANIEDKVLAKEDSSSEAAKTYANIVAVQSAHKDDEKIKALVKALNTEDVKSFIDSKYNGLVVPLVPTNDWVS